MGTIWTVDAEGTLTPHRVITGLTDGQKTQINSRDLKAGTSIVISQAQPGATTTAATTTRNPLQPAAAQGGGPRGPF